MEKIIKFCPVCKEYFAEQFAFCPDCAAELEAYQVNNKRQNNQSDSHVEKLGDDGNPNYYSVTFVEQRGGELRRALMLGAFVLIMGGAIFSVVLSIYNSEAFVAGFDENLTNIVYAPVDEPIELEPEPVTEKDQEQGGGGRGGNNDPNPVSKGQYANQSDDPKIAPTVNSYRLKNPEIPIQMETKGVVRRPLTNDPYGDPASKFDVPSDGPGSGGGQGTGPDRGQGTGPGPGAGPNSGPGIGPGPGGPGGRPRDEDDDKKPPPLIVGPTTAIKIISKPRAIYTDAARKNQIAGTVTLRVTFMANGTIGNIAVVSGLPEGLTEQAITAARNIQFEPAKRGGVAQTVTKQVQYTFTLY
jgi:TonB family protein